jgi:chromosome segregation ATPase
MLNSWIKSARAWLDKLEWELEYVRNERTELSVQVNDLEKEVKRLREREATFDEFIDSLDGQNEHEWMLIERIDEIHERLHGGEQE